MFVHVPKCGGTSIEDAIWPDRGARTAADLWAGQGPDDANKYQADGLQHLKAWQIREEVGADVFRDYFKFAFVRNPYDKAVSQYEYMKRTRKTLRGRIGMADDATFAEHLRLIRGRPHPHWDPQHTFLFDERGALLVDFVGRFERFEADAQRAFDALGLGARLGGWRSVRVPHAKGGGARPSYREYYDDETREAVREMYARDLEVFGYTF